MLTRAVTGRPAALPEFRARPGVRQLIEAEERMRRRSQVWLIVAAAVLMTAAPGQSQPQIARFELPADVTFPEGIAYDAKAGVIYTGSAATGNLVRVTLGSKQATTVAPAGSLMATEPFPALLGMKVDGAGRVWISGGRTGQMVVVD
jgi:hypothetical protein